MKSSARLGLTLLEVIFAMVVILVGLVAVGLLIPLAGRQAEDAYQITQGLAAGESALAVFNSDSTVQPSLDAPWCLVDDVANSEYSLSSFQQAYNQIAESFPAPADTTLAAVAQNEAIGIGFCIDPHFWGFQSRILGDRLATPFARTRFPFLNSDTNPTTLQTSNRPAPRLIRGSLTDPSVSFPGSWLRQPAAVRLATMDGGDLVQPATKNKALGPLRSVYVSGDPGAPLVSSPHAPQQTAWMMTITPSDNTPILPITRTVENWDGIDNNPGSVKSNHPVGIPSSYNVALVVFSKRDPREVLSIIPTDPPTNLPIGERAVRVTGFSLEAVNSGSFFVTLAGHPSLDAKIKIGDWLMMSRYTKQELLPRPANQGDATMISRQVHHWYRIIGVSGEDVFPRTVRVYGRPWGWTEGEISDLVDRGLALPTIPPPPNLYETHAVLLKDVVHVYERQIDL
jgi:type II secretory pathway pseudopilin PulG